MFEPLGVCLILAPWNYPFQLLINPLIGAISAGCCAIVKPSPDTPHVAKLIQDLLEKNFNKDHVAVIQGGRTVNEWLFHEKFDLIFFTGSTTVGKVVMEAASTNLTPVILELGGKSPCIVDVGTNLEIAARRIMWGKTINAGQTCIAPDYLLVHESVKEGLLTELKNAVVKLYGTDLLNSAYYGRIVNEDAFNRLTSLLQKGKIEMGGGKDIQERFISPTIISGVSMEDEIMQREIFGPILPMITFNNLDEAVKIIRSGEKPLALYYFGKGDASKKVLQETSSGGACINDTLVHIANHELPFGGVGASGFGRYHGIYSFLSFSNQKAVIKTPTWIDLAFRYPPFKYFSFTKKIT